MPVRLSSTVFLLILMVTSAAVHSAGSPAEQSGEGVRPFGSKLFDGGFQGEREDGLNPDYLVRPGDHITLRMWGAVDHSGVVVVDAQGNVFLPEIGPIRVAGIQNAKLSERILHAVRAVFTQNVDVYTNLEGTSPVVVYVAGYAMAPGSYAGVSSDSLLYFLSRAGGVDPRQGSYRNVTVKRGEEVLEEVDLYEFLLEGSLTRLQFMDGDTILVRPKGGTVEVTGNVRNGYQFEIPQGGVSGRMPVSPMCLCRVSGGSDPTRPTSRSRSSCRIRFRMVTGSSFT